MSISDRQVRRLRKLMEHHGQLNISAAAAGMDEKTARKYLRAGKVPSEMQVEHSWRTREDPFTEVWNEAKSFLELNDGLEAKTIFEHLQRTYPGRFSDGQLRTFQRKVKQWRALDGPAQEVFFAQMHRPGKLCQSDFTFMNSLRITIGGQLSIPAKPATLSGRNLPPSPGETCHPEGDARLAGSSIGDRQDCGQLS